MTARKITGPRVVLCIWVLSAAAAVLGLNQSISPWITVPLVLPVIVLVPGLLVLMTLKVRTSTHIEYAVYAIGVSLAFWLLGGLMLNEILPLLGVAAPLSILPLSLFFATEVSVLGLVVALRGPSQSFTIRLGYPGSHLARVVMPSVLVVMSVIGANILNNGGSGVMSIIVLLGIAAYVIFIVSIRSEVTDLEYVLGVSAIALALLLMYSLRSWHILGWDIHGEFAVFMETLGHHRWSMEFFPSQPYNACLSVTILPTILHEFTHLSGEYVFKVAYQMLFAICPAIVYAIAVRYIEPRLAFLASIILVSQTWFYQQMPALIRQEIAFILFSLVLLIMFDKEMSKRTRWILYSLFISSLVVSHYSTAYICLILLLLGAVLSVLARRVWPRVGGRSAGSSAFSPAKIVFAVVILLLWQGSVTHTLGAATSFLSEGSGHLREAVSVTAIKNGLEHAFLGSPNVSTSGNLVAVYHLALMQAQQYSDDLYPASTYGQYAPRVQNDARYLDSLLPNTVSSWIRGLAIASKAMLTNILTIVGTALILVGVRKKRPLADFDYGILSLAACMLILAFLFVPYLQEEYNLTRLYLQAMVVLSCAAVVGLWFLVGRLERMKYVAASVLVAFAMLFLTGAMNHIIGGAVNVTTSRQGSALDRFYTSDQEVAAAKWLRVYREPWMPVYADVIANLRLQSYANIDANTSVFPSTLTRDCYVYLDTLNVKNDLAYYHYYNTTLVASFPTAFLNAQKDSIYSNGSALIYR